MRARFLGASRRSQTSSFYDETVKKSETTRCDPGSQQLVIASWGRAAPLVQLPIDEFFVFQVTGWRRASMDPTEQRTADKRAGSWTATVESWKSH